jgi:glycosyltransferase involved in cell wall biosynthesis
MVAFVVLNYKNFDDTKICVDSLIKFSAEKAKIVVVDNHSDDESFCRLTELYKSEKNVEIVQNKQNFGFSKGNNIGCKIAMEKFNADFLCIINNDTYIDDGEFCEKIEEIHAETNFDILAPCVWNTRKNFNQNPFMVPSNEKELKTEIENIEKGLKILKFGAIPYWIYGHLCNSLTCVLCWWGGSYRKIA